MSKEKNDNKANNQISWNDNRMQNAYANIATVTANQEEFSLLFGMHQHWRGSSTENQTLEVELLHRIIMSPTAVKRFSTTLSMAVEAYEKEYGVLKI